MRHRAAEGIEVQEIGLDDLSEDERAMVQAMMARGTAVVKTDEASLDTIIINTRNA